MTVLSMDAAPIRVRRSLSWDGAPEEAAAGEPFELRLVLSGGAAPGTVSPSVDLPENAIFDGLPVTEAQLRDGTVSRFRV
jgi:hypothetical protein